MHRSSITLAVAALAMLSHSVQSEPCTITIKARRGVDMPKAYCAPDRNLRDPWRRRNRRHERANK